jgi:hypothetical protein
VNLKSVSKIKRGQGRVGQCVPHSSQRSGLKSGQIEIFFKSVYVRIELNNLRALPP